MTTAFPATTPDHVAATGRVASSVPLKRVVRYVATLRAALGDDPAFYDRLVAQGFLQNAIDHAQVAGSVARAERAGWADDIHVEVVDVLLRARACSVRRAPELVALLDQAGVAAASLASGIAPASSTTA